MAEVPGTSVVVVLDEDVPPAAEVVGAIVVDVDGALVEGVDVVVVDAASPRHATATTARTTSRTPRWIMTMKRHSARFRFRPTPP